jgi:c(7)-type cytochrome triheme protein
MWPTRRTASAVTANERSDATARPIIRAALFVAVACTVQPLPLAAKGGGGDIEYAPHGAGRVLFDHAYHVRQKGLSCASCHYGIFQMTKSSAYRMDMSMITKGKFCGSCHNGRTAFDVKDANSCLRCHKD